MMERRKPGGDHGILDFLDIYRMFTTDTNNASAVKPLTQDDLSGSRLESPALLQDWWQGYPVWQRQRDAAVPMVIVVTLAAVLGLVGNLLVAALLCCQRWRPRTTTSLYLLHRAIADSCVQICQPLMVITVVSGNHPWACIFNPALMQLGMLASTFLLSGLALDSVLASKPRVFHARTRWRLVRGVVTAAWLSGLVIFTVTGLGIFRQGDMCLEAPLFLIHTHDAVFVFFLLVFLLPLVVLGMSMLLLLKTRAGMALEGIGVRKRRGLGRRAKVTWKLEHNMEGGSGKGLEDREHKLTWRLDQDMEGRPGMDKGGKEHKITWKLEQDMEGRTGKDIGEGRDRKLTWKLEEGMEGRTGKDIEGKKHKEIAWTTKLDMAGKTGKDIEGKEHKLTGKLEQNIKKTGRGKDAGKEHRVTWKLTGDTANQRLGNIEMAKEIPKRIPRSKRGTGKAKVGKNKDDTEHQTTEKTKKGGRGKLGKENKATIGTEHNMAKRKDRVRWDIETGARESGTDKRGTENEVTRGDRGKENVDIEGTSDMGREDTEIQVTENDRDKEGIENGVTESGRGRKGIEKEVTEAGGGMESPENSGTESDRDQSSTETDRTEPNAPQTSNQTQNKTETGHQNTSSSVPHPTTSLSHSNSTPASSVSSLSGSNTSPVARVSPLPQPNTSPASSVTSLLRHDATSVPHGSTLSSSHASPASTLSSSHTSPASPASTLSSSHTFPAPPVSVLTRTSVTPLPARTRLLAALGLVFAVSHLPYWVMRIHYARVPELLPFPVHAVIICLVVVGTALDPILAVWYRVELYQGFVSCLPTHPSAAVPLESV